jgi:GTPase SAR1 family protein
MNDFSVKIFYSYSHKDEKHRDQMEKFLRMLKTQGLVEHWSDRSILAGQHIEKTIEDEIKSSEIIAFLISVDFLTSSACQKELMLAKEMAEKSGKKLISVIVRECPWQDYESLSSYLATPKDGKAISTWESNDEAWTDVYHDFKKVINEIKKNFEVKSEFQEELRSLEFCSQSNQDLDFSKIFVVPNLSKMSEKEEKKLSVRNSDELLKEKKVLMYGDSQSGKTKLCSHLFLEILSKKKPVLFINLNNLAHKKPSLNNFKDSYEGQYHGDFNCWIKQENKTIIFDNLSHERNCLDYISMAEVYFENVIISTSDDYYNSYFSDEIRLSNYTPISILPFTHVKQEKLIKNWLDESKSGQEIEGYHGRVDKIENNINSIIIHNKILPRYPFFILSILQTYEAFMPQNIEITAYGHCYYALILAHLVKSGIEPKDESISACFNYARNLAFEIFDKGPSSLTISSEQLKDFDERYNEKYLISNSLINRLRGRYGILRLTPNGEMSFSLSYSYYYFLGGYLSKHYNENRVSEIVSEIIENSHKKNNSTTLIFTVHHAHDLKIIDEILTHTACAIDQLKPATLDTNETEIFYELLTSIPENLKSNGIEKDRESEREFRDRAEKDQDHPTGFNDIDEQKRGNRLLNEIYHCNKNIDVLSQVLRNNVGNLERKKISEIAETICDAGLRLSRILITDKDEINDLINYIHVRLKKDKEKSQIKKSKIKEKDIRKAVLFHVFLWVMSNIEKVVSSINKPEIGPVIKELSQLKNSPAYLIIYYFYSLDTSESFTKRNKEQLESLLKKYQGKEHYFLRKILSIRTQHYINTHQIDDPIYQATCSALKIDYKPKFNNRISTHVPAGKVKKS